MNKIPRGKILIGLVIIAMLLSYIPIIAVPSASGQLPLPSGNLYIPAGTTFVINENTIDPLTGQTGQYGMSGSLYVNSSGTLIIDNATLYFRQDALHHFRMYVNGTLIMNNAVLKDTWNALDPYLHLNVSFFGGALQTQKSLFEFPGNVYFNGAKVVMKNTEFNEIPNLDPLFNSNNINESSPTPYFYNSQAYLDNVSFKSMFHPDSINSTLIANNTSGISNENLSAGQSYTEYSTLSALKYPPNTLVSQISVWGKYRSAGNASITVYAAGNNISFFKIVSTRGNISKFNITIPSHNTTLPLLKLRQLYRNNVYAVLKDSSGSRYFNVTTLYFEIYTNDAVNYYGPSNFNFTLVNSQIYGRDVYIDANYNSYYSNQSTGRMNNQKNTIALVDSSALYVANLTVNDTTLTNYTRIYGSPPFIVDSSSFVYIYRYADINVSTSQGYPVNGAHVVISEDWPSTYSNAQQYDYFASYYNSLLQTTLVANGMLPSNYNYTSQGETVIPVLSDVFNSSTSPNTRSFGHYSISITGGLKSNFTFGSFPSLTSTSNHILVNMTFVAPFVYYSLNSYSSFISGDTVTLKVNATSYLNSVSGTFVVMSDGIEIGSSSTIDLVANSTTPIVIQFPDALSTGTHNISIEFTSNQLYSSSSPIELKNITSYTNVALTTKATLLPLYQQGGALISGYGGKLTIQVGNLGTQSSGVTKVFVNYTFPSGGSQSSNFLDIISGNSNVTTVLPLPIVTTNVQGNLGVSITAVTSSGVIPYSTSGNSYRIVYPVIPTPSISVTSINLNSTYFNGVRASGTVSLTSNEMVENVSVEVFVGGNELTYEIPSMNGLYNLPITIPSSYVKVGINNVTVVISNVSQPYLLGVHSMSGGLRVVPNYGFRIISPQILFSGNITSYVNGTLSFGVENIGNNSTGTIPIEILSSGVVVDYLNVTAPSYAALVPISLPYSPLMNLEIIANYNSQYPSSYNYFPYMYYNETVPVPYFYTSYSFPGQILNGSSLTGTVYINNVANYHSNNTVIGLYLGSTQIYQKSLGNLPVGYTTSIPVYYNTSSDPHIMNSLLTATYQETLVVRNGVTGNFGIIINLGTLSLIEKPNFIISNITIISGGHNVTTIYAGEQFKVGYQVTNNGGSVSNGPIYYRVLVARSGSNLLLYQGSLNQQIYPGQSVSVLSQNITTKATVSGSLEVLFNYNNTINTEIKGAQNVSVPVQILNPKVRFIIIPQSASVTSGQVELLNIRAINENTSLGWQTNITVVVMQGGKIIEKQNGQTNLQGLYSISFRVINTGSYTVEIIYQGPQGTTSQSNPGVFSVKAAPIVVPIFVYPIIVVAALIGGFFYGYNYLKKKNIGLVQCSVCGALIPEGATKCPRCGTEFEKDRVKCSECDSWIPEDSKFCPNCGAVFIGREDSGYVGLVKLKNEYDKFLDTYRQKAKAILGEKINEMEFQNWWRNGPDYKAFRQWVTEKGLSPDDLVKTENKNGTDQEHVDLKVEKKKKGLFRKK